MWERMHKTGTEVVGCPQRARTESEWYGGAQTCIWMVEDNVVEVPFDREHLLESILTPENLNKAYKAVISNKGCGGIDKMSCDELLPWLLANKKNLICSLLDGSYRPNPVLRVEIPKENGKMRQLGIPTVVDPLRRAKDIVNSGYKYVVDLDLERFFDTVCHSRLIEILSRTIKDGRVVSLIHKYLRSGILNHGMFEASNEGTPQGGPLSPLLSNIMLNELDKELTRRGHPFVRYADDSMIFCRSKSAAEQTKESIIRFIEGQLHLRVNKEKTTASYVKGVKYLGYSFYNSKGKFELCVHPKSKAKMKSRLKELTGRSNGMGYERRKQRLNEYIRGWIGYYRLANMKRLLDEWLRRRIRMCIWKSWKNPKTRISNLIRCGIPKRKAHEWGYTRLGYWRIADSWLTHSSMTNERLKIAGYPTLYDEYLKWYPK